MTQHESSSNRASRRRLFRAHIATWLAALSLAMLFAPIALAKPPLTAWAPDDAGLCIEITNFDAHVDGVLASRLFQNCQHLPVLREVELAANMRKLVRLSEGLAKQIGADPKEVRRKLFGQELVLCVWPNAQGGDVLASGLLLFESADRELLVALQRLLTEPLANRPMDVRREEYADQEYVVCRHESNASLALAVVGNVALVTGDEQLLRRSLDLVAETEGGLAADDHYRDAQTRIATDAPFRFFVQPAVWNQRLAEGDVLEEIDSNLLVRALYEGWRNTRYWVTAIRPGAVVDFQSYVACRPGDLISPLDTLVEGMRGEVHFFDRVPESAVVAMGTCGDLSQAVRMLRESSGGSSPPGTRSGGASTRQASVSPRQVQNLINEMFVGLQLFEPMLAELGPNLGGYLRAAAPDKELSSSAASTPSNGNSATPKWPVDWVLGLEARGASPRPAEDGGADQGEAGASADSGAPPRMLEKLDETLQLAMNFALSMRRGGSSKPLGRLVSRQIGDATVRSLVESSLLPPGMVGAYSVHRDYLWAGTSTEAVAEAVGIEPQTSLARSARWRELMGDDDATFGQALYIDGRRLRRLLADHPQQMATLVGGWRGLSQATATRALEQLGWLIEPVDAVGATANVEEEGVRLRLRVREK